MMSNFMSGIFNSNDFMPHGQCFLWYPEVLWLHVISDLIITLAYFSIPISILYVVLKRSRIPFRLIYLMFGAFIFLCGITHLTAIWVIWDPVYRLQGIFKAMTAGVSIATAILIVPFIPHLITAMEKIDDSE